MDKDYKNFFIWVFFLIIFGVNFYIYSFFWVVSLMLNFVFLFILHYILSYFYRFVFKLNKPKIIDSLLNFSFWLGLFLSIIIIFIWGFSIRYNEFKPHPVTNYVITDGKKEVIFQWMMHIWNKDFYDEVSSEILEKKKDGYVLFYEWARPWTKENLEKFREALWFDISSSFYNSFAKFLDVKAQNNDDFLEKYNNLDYNVDLSIDDIVKLYNTKVTSWQQTPKVQFKSEDFDSFVSLYLENSSPRELSVLRYIIKWFMNYIFTFSIENLHTQAKKLSIFDVILNDRNKNLAYEVLSSEYEKIYIIYWDAHFNWFFEYLKSENPKWRIRKISKKYPLSSK